jgi:hypothetical protein
MSDVSSANDAKAVSQTLDRPLFVLDDAGCIGAASRPLLQLLCANESDVIGRRAEDVFAGAAALIAARSSGAISFRCAAGRNWRAQLSIEILNVTSDRGVVVGTLNGVRANAPGKATPCAKKGRLPLETDAAGLGEAIRARLASCGAPQKLIAGRIEVIGLEEVKVALGPKWAANAARAKDLAKSIISRRLGESDMFTEITDDAFLICFASLSTEEAAVKAKMIAQEIRARLVGEDESKFVVVPRVAEVVVEQQDAGDDATLIETLTRRLDSARAERKRSAHLKIKDLVEQAHLVVSPVLTKLQRPTGLWLASLDGDYGPCLSNVGSREDGLKTTFELDALLLGLACEHLLSALDRGQAPSIIVPVNYSTLNERKFSQQYMTLCRRMDEAAYSRFLFEIVDIAQDVPNVRLQEVFSILAPYSAHRLLRAPNVTYQMTDLNSLRITMVSLNFSRSHVAVASKSKMLKKFTSIVHNGGTFPSVSRSNSVRLLVRNVPTPEMAQWYTSRGVDFVCVAPQTKPPDEDVFFVS